MDCNVQRVMLGAFFLNCALVFNLHAGGSGLNTVVIVNQASSNSCELGNYFCESRSVPPENVLRIYWSGTNTAWTSNDFQAVLLTPLLDMLDARQLTNQIEYVVLSMDIPFQTSFGSTLNSTTAALFYGVKPTGWGPEIDNSYAETEAIFRQASPTSAQGFSFLTTMITAGSLAQAKQLVDQGVASDGSFPSQPVILAKTSDASRNLRYTFFDNAVFNVKVRGVSSILRTNSDSLSGQTNLMGLETGLDKWSVTPGTFVPGSIADSMTSYGGVIFGPNTQTNLLAMIAGGAAGSYGTVAEPGTDTEKFPNPQVYFYQSRGFSLAESYYQSVNAPVFGLTVAEPLAAPFERTGYGMWSNSLSSSVISNTTMLSVQFYAANGNRPLQQVDLFVDGKYLSTATNIAPSPGNLLTLALNGYPISYTVLSNETLATIATNMAALINLPANTNATKVKAVVHGDRIELQSLAADAATVPFYVADTTPTNMPGLSYLVNYLPDTFPPRMIAPGVGADGSFKMEVEIPSTMHYVVQASTNLAEWVSILTNAEPGLLDFQDAEAVKYPSRFYRVGGPDPNQPPVLNAQGINDDGTFEIHVESVAGLLCAVFASTNLINWSPIFTNGQGGIFDFVDPDTVNSEYRFYRAGLVSPSPPEFSVLHGTSGVTLIRIDDAVRPYTVEVSTNGDEWTGLVTNFALGDILTTASSDIGSGSMLSTFLRASRSRFQPSEAFGFQKYIVISNSVAAGAWLRLTITKTNGQVVVVGVTNQSGSTSTSAILAADLFTRVNTNSALQGSDGVIAEDFDVASSTTFNLRARSAGLQAAAITVLAQRSTGLTFIPSTQKTLTLNLPDLQSRNHLYVSAGASNLTLVFPLNTTNLPDGCHELTAVAYEGSHVRTQTRATVPVEVQNTPLSATLTLLDLTNTASVMGNYHIEVAANTNDVSLITLFSTGGAMGTVTNESTGTFEVSGTNLWAGLHPFYAVVETSSGLKYRTKAQWVRFLNQ